MKRFLFLSLSFMISSTLFGMKEEKALVNMMENLEICDVSIDKTLEIKSANLKKFVADLKEKKQIECENENGHTLLQLAVNKYKNLEDEIATIKHRLEIYFSDEDEETIVESFKSQQELSNLFLDKKLLLQKCFRLMELLLEANAKIHSVGRNKTNLYKQVLFSPLALKEITELFVSEKEKRDKNKKLKKEMSKKEQENK